MAEDEMMFDPTMKKKKKKKKVPLDLDGLEGEGVVEDKDGAPEANDNEQDEPKDVSLDLEDFSEMKKKKKKKKKVFDMDSLENSLPDTADGSTEKKEDANDAVDEAQDLDELDFNLPTKKKKKKKKITIDKESAEKAMENGAESGEDEGEGNEAEDVMAAEDREYTYDELLERVFDIMRAKNPDMVAGEKRKFVMKPPQVVRIGSKKTSFANFTDICKILHRQPKHLLAFLMAELGTSGSCDGNNQLIIKGRFQQKQIETVLRRYIKEYVTCHTCRSPDTILQKETRLFFLQCETCGSRCSVASIKSGFQAITGKRAQLKNKQQ
ncbi:eukaryotic translation initiation factor 2 subunit 2-like [Actinia tenebrosa]|uniref:Eukaryotic translation initiation factor 2 subunit 2 n=1 Tax=Actinia tenebrosa TaxID=6105 RepID=A0A6P8IKC1_ACTTE|nr:eukaryotic translation initiation factor 2 subunit 2-like [Actinia tenebrosa]